MSSLCTAHVTVLIKQAEVRPAKSTLYRKTMWKFPSQLYLPKSPSRSNLVIPKYNQDQEEGKKRKNKTLYIWNEKLK